MYQGSWLRIVRRQKVGNQGKNLPVKFRKNWLVFWIHTFQASAGTDSTQKPKDKVVKMWLIICSILHWCIYLSWFRIRDFFFRSWIGHTCPADILIGFPILLYLSTMSWPEYLSVSALLRLNWIVWFYAQGVRACPKFASKIVLIPPEMGSQVTW